VLRFGSALGFPLDFLGVTINVLHATPAPRLLSLPHPIVATKMLPQITADHKRLSKIMTSIVPEERLHALRDAQRPFVSFQKYLCILSR
jgi:hypothetical protein